jgi:large subunit ribosomal protein L13
MMVKNPEKAMMLAVGGMLPHNTVGRKSLTRLRVYAGNTHEQAAQKPEVFEI